jgi:hypothetical protein
MFAIAKNEFLQNGLNTTTFQRWCQEVVHEFNFETEGYVIKNLRKDKNINPRFLSRIEIGSIDINPVPFTCANLSVNEFRLAKSILPFGIPKNDIAYEFFGEMMENVYDNGATGKIENDNITSAMLLAIMRKVVYDLGKDDLKVGNEPHFIKILISLYLTTKEYNLRSAKFKSLIDGLVECANTRDVTQREICIMLSGSPMTDIIFDQLMTISLSRSLKHFKADYGDRKYTLKEKKFLKGKFGLFFIVPLLKFVNEYNEQNIILYQAKLNECNKLFVDGLDMNKSDDNWELTCEILSKMTNIMIDYCGVNITKRDAKYFMDKLTEISKADIANVDKMLVNKDYESEKYTPKMIPYQKDIFIHSCMPIMIKENDKTIVTSSRITKWSGFDVKLKDGEMVGIEWDDMINARKHTMVAPVIKFLCGDDPYITNYKGGSYLPITGELVYKTQIDHVIQKEKYLLLKKVVGGIEIYTDNGKIVMQCDKLSVAFKNMKIRLYDVKI